MKKAAETSKEKDQDKAAVIAKLMALEKTHGKGVTAIVVEDKVAFFKKPSRPQLSYALTLMGSDILAAYESVLNGTFIEGDRCIIDEDEYFMAAGPQVNSMIGSKSAELVKL